MVNNLMLQTKRKGLGGKCGDIHVNVWREEKDLPEGRIEIWTTRGESWVGTHADAVNLTKFIIDSIGEPDTTSSPSPLSVHAL